MISARQKQHWDHEAGDIAVYRVRRTRQISCSKKRRHNDSHRDVGLCPIYIQPISDRYPTLSGDSMDEKLVKLEDQRLECWKHHVWHTSAT